MSTVAQVADRALRSWLRPPDDQPVILTLGGDVDSSTQSFSYSDSTLAPDEEELVGPGILIEVGIEQCRVTDVDHDANTLTVIRGVNGTTAAAHSEDDEITVAPTFTRGDLVEAVYDQVVALFPTLWHVDTYELTTASTFVEVPEEVITPTVMWVQSGDNWYPVRDPFLMSDFPPSSTSKAIQTSGITDGRTAHLVYHSKFARPSAESDDLTADFGVDASWERIIEVGAAAQVVGQRPVDSLTAEYITEQLEREALPPGSATDIRNGLLTLRGIWLDEARKSIQSERGTAVTYNRLTAVR